MEKKIEEKLRLGVKDKGGIALKFVCPGTNGAPDRLVIAADGKIHFVETKSNRGKLSALQNAFQRMLGMYGHPVHVVKTNEQLNTFLNGI